MILTRFFKSKWPSNNTKSNVRDQDNDSHAAADLPRIACEEDDPALRQAALQRITDLALLLQRSEQDPVDEVRAAASMRYRAVLAGSAPDSPSWEQRQAHISAELPCDLLRYLAQQGKEAELRLAIVEYLHQDEILETIAVGDAVTKVQLAALDRITAQDCLERIARQTRNKNKRVYRTAQERLDKLHAEQEKIAEIERVCQSMEALAAEPDSHPRDTRFQALEREWNRQTITIEDSISQRYQQARDRILQRARQTVARQQQQVERFDSLESLLERLQQTDEWSPPLAAAIRDALAQFGNDNQSPTTAAEIRVDRLLQAIRERERILQHDHARIERQRALIRQMTELADSGNSFREATLERFRKQWKSLEHPESERLASSLQQRFDSSLQSLQECLQVRAEQNAATVGQLHADIDQLEQALGDGELQQAIELQEQIRNRIKKEPLPRADKSALEQRLHECAATIGKLRGWRRWGTKQAREHLCEEAESLIDALEEPSIIAKRVQQLRSNWKSLDSTEGAASKALWERFNTACENAYVPVQRYFDQLAQERKENLAKRQAVCLELENLFASTDWEHADWRALDKSYRDADKQWHQLGPVDRAERKPIERRFRAVTRQFDEKLQVQRLADRQRREALIEEVEQLLTQEDIRSAIEQAKQAQAKWQPTVLSSRRQEQALWKRFRAACDAIFERRQSEQQLIDRERQENLTRKMQICEAIEQLSERAITDRTQSELQELRTSWSGTGRVPQADYKKLEQRFAQACKELEQHIRMQQQDQLRRELKNMRERALLCNRIESLLVSTDVAVDSVIEQVRCEWQTMTPLPDHLQQAMQQRLERACTAVTSENAEISKQLRQELENNLALKQQFCLRMEILAGIDSPPEFAQARMQYQVSRLSDSLSGERAVHTDKRQEAQDIERQWSLLGLLPPEQGAALEARFQRACSAFVAQA